MVTWGSPGIPLDLRITTGQTRGSLRDFAACSRCQGQQLQLGRQEIFPKCPTMTLFIYLRYIQMLYIYILYIYTYKHIYIYIYLHIYIFTYIYIYTFTYIYIYIDICCCFCSIFLLLYIISLYLCVNCCYWVTQLGLVKSVASPGFSESVHDPPPTHHIHRGEGYIDIYTHMYYLHIYIYTYIYIYTHIYIYIYIYVHI